MLFPGFAASEILYNEGGAVVGVATGDMGVSREGEQKGSFTPGYELRGKYTIFAEGCRGHLGKQLIKKYELDKDSGTQHYGIGLKELWSVAPEKHVPGKVIHAIGGRSDSCLVRLPEERFYTIYRTIRYLWV